MTSDSKYTCSKMRKYSQHVSKFRLYGAGKQCPRRINSWQNFILAKLARSLKTHSWMDANTTNKMKSLGNWWTYLHAYLRIVWYNNNTVHSCSQKRKWYVPPRLMIIHNVVYIEPDGSVQKLSICVFWCSLKFNKYNSKMEFSATVFSNE